MTSVHDEFEDLHGNPDAGEDVTFEDAEPEAAQTAQESGFADDDGDVDEYGRKVQKRIAKEVSKRKALEDSLAQHQAYIAQLHERLSGIEQRFAGEDQARQETEAERRLEELRASRRKAYDEGDLDTYEKLDDEYLEARAEVLARKQGPGGGRRGPSQPQAPAGNAQPGVPEPMAGWMADNRAWFNGDQANAAKVRSANALFDTLVAEGFDQHDPATYAELDRRLTGAGIKARRSRDPMGAVSASRVSGGTGGGSREFTQEDARIMRKYGMDPNDPRQRKGYMQDKDGSSPL